jgi:hypothetical protein
VPHPAGLPDLFIDRSLGRIQVPALLRAEGLRLVTLAERFGVPEDEDVSDEQWLADAGMRGEVVFMKDARVRYNAAEKRVVIEESVRCFCLARRDLTAAEMASRFIRNLERIELACAQPGPFIFAVHDNRIERLTLV